MPQAGSTPLFLPKDALWKVCKFQKAPWKPLAPEGLEHGSEDEIVSGYQQLTHPQGFEVLPCQIQVLLEPSQDMRHS